MQTLPDKLYSVDSIVQIEQLAINEYGIPACELMKRAGKAAFDVIKTRYPQCTKILVLCGAGNNAGDGYVVAALAKQAGLTVYLISLADCSSLKNEAQLAYEDWLKLSENNNADLALLDKADIVIDALLGTGLSRPIVPEWKKWIDAINNAVNPVVSIDIPSGLRADTGAITDVSIIADMTVSYVGLKQGMFTAQAKDVCGEIIFDDLAIPAEAYLRVKNQALLIHEVNYSLLPQRKASSHKGHFGHVLLVGGNDAMPGALILAATAALRTGAGLLTILTTEKNRQSISSAVPEAMIKIADTDVSNLFDDAAFADITHVAIGMGLGQDEWSYAVLKHCMQLNKPMVIDADALNLMATHGIEPPTQVVITPHPGEASRLLKNAGFTNSADVQANRFDAVKRLHKSFDSAQSCVVILKGSGTLIYDGRTTKICNMGNAALSSPGMGDVLSGVVVALMAQKISITDSAELAVCLHASAAASVIKDRTRGLLASDVVSALPNVLQ